jgi:hypothetical protein
MYSSAWPAAPLYGKAPYCACHAIAEVISANPQGLIVNSNLAQQAGFSIRRDTAAGATSASGCAAAAAAAAAADAAAAPAAGFVADFSAVQQAEIAALLAQLQLTTNSDM